MKSTTASPAKSTRSGASAHTAAKQRTVQRTQDAKDSAKPAARKSSQPAQAGPRSQPVNPLPAQHLSKPGLEAEMALRPRFEAPDYKGSGKLEGMAALVTGGDSGIGRAVALLYAREGADVAIAYLDEDEDAEETRRHVEAEGARCILVKGDVCDPAFCRDAVDQTLEAFGKLDILVNNAAFQLHAASIEDITDERFELTLRTNVFGYFQMARAAVPHLGQGASIINTGSVTGLEGSAHLLDYSTTKGAIHAFTKSLASNLLPKGIRVNAVAPGPVWTPLNPADSPPGKIKDFGKNTDLQRPAQPEELSPAYVFLAAPSCASYITGIVLPVTGSVGAV
ncbi:SDR family oxidoreductase [Variovorax paradoxus]|uniref:NAD(P)-dependent dehydrogenase (Short-subunit alcohol dehydrogenase family) n=1 Tax=Variovorax paradoxus TaxID=34073 RepID=A0AAW8EDL4_VARPD|nr:SDR family oxidoreductase [Variovorax paradoxus]MDP9970920.1 NAD(P)-dependent dehydrogenase (short-subunit alcohol dehydrogenase family) [Variovorax paradoxus]